MRHGREASSNNEEVVNTSNRVDLNNLIKKVRDEEKKSRRNNVVVWAAAVSALAVFVIILTLTSRNYFNVIFIHYVSAFGFEDTSETHYKASGIVAPTYLSKEWQSHQ